ncbi:MAG: hypothetical protein ABIY48_10825 [Acidimicrobiales bacterium]
MAAEDTAAGLGSVRATVAPGRYVLLVLPDTARGGISTFTLSVSLR